MATTRQERKLTLYRDDSTSQVVYERVKAWFWTAGNTVLVISQYSGPEGGEHHYIHWPRERFCWFKDTPASPPRNFDDIKEGVTDGLS
jgi:hypothetical protein